VTAKPLSSIAAAAAAMAVPPIPVKWTDLIADENMGGKFNHQDAKAQSFLKSKMQFNQRNQSLRNRI